MTLSEFLGVLCSLIGAAAGVIISLACGLGWWSLLVGLGGLTVGWCAGVGTAIALVRSNVLTPPEYKRKAEAEQPNPCD